MNRNSLLNRLVRLKIRIVLSPTPTTDTHTLSLHDALPIYQPFIDAADDHLVQEAGSRRLAKHAERQFLRQVDRKSTRLNSSHSQISYAVSCLKKKTMSAPCWRVAMWRSCSRPTRRPARPGW